MTICAFCQRRIRGDFTELVYRRPIQVHHLHRRCVDAFIGVHRLLGSRMSMFTEIDGFPPQF